MCFMLSQVCNSLLGKIKMINQCSKLLVLFFPAWLPSLTVSSIPPHSTFQLHSSHLTAPPCPTQSSLFVCLFVSLACPQPALACFPLSIFHTWHHEVASNSLQPMNCSPPDSSVPGMFQARILEWVAISSPRGSSPSRD